MIRAEAGGVLTTPKERRAAWPMVLLCAAIAGHLVLLALLRSGGLTPLFNDAVHRLGPGCDFFSIYAAAWKASHGLSVYRQISALPPALPYGYVYRYPPAPALLLESPLVHLPPLVCYGGWVVLCELVLLQDIRLTWRLARTPPARAVTTAMWLLFSPYFLELFVGQFTFVTASLGLWAYLHWRPKSGAGKAGPTASVGDVCWGMGVLLKLMPLVLLPVAILRRRWVCVGTTTAVFVATSLWYFRQFPQDWSLYVHDNMHAVPPLSGGNQGLMALLWIALRENPARYASVRPMCLLLVSLPLLRLWRDTRRAVQGPTPEAAEPMMDRLFAAGTAAYFLVSPDVWEHHYALLLPALVLLAARGHSPCLWTIPFLIAALPTPFIWYDIRNLPYTADPDGLWPLSVRLLHHACKPLAAVWLFTTVTRPRALGTQR